MTNYKIEYYNVDSGDFWDDAITRYRSGTSFTARSLECNTRYAFRVWARGDGTTYSTTYVYVTIISTVTKACNGGNTGGSSGGGGGGGDLTPTFNVNTISPVVATVNQSFTKTLPGASSGNGTLRYSISPALPSGLAFNSSTRVLSGRPTAAQAAATYTYKVTDTDTASNRPNDIDTLSLTITINPQGGSNANTPSPQVTNIDVTMKYAMGGLKYSMTSGVRWKINEVKYVLLTIEGTNDWEIPSDYTFRLRLNTDETGLQITRNRICDWAPVARDTDAWRKRNEIELNLVDDKVAVQIIRCGKGQLNNEGFDLEVGHSANSNTTSKDIVNNLAMAPYQKNSVVLYHLDPSGAPAGSPLRELSAYSKGSSFWNGIVNNHSLSRTLTESNSNIAIEMVDGTICGDEAVLGCVILDYSKEELPGGKFRITVIDQVPMKMKIDLGPDSDWVLEYLEYESNEGYFIYLPHVVGHEFGHALGFKGLDVVGHEFGHALGFKGLDNVEESIMLEEIGPGVQPRDVPPCTFDAHLNDRCGQAEFDIAMFKSLYAWND